MANLIGLLLGFAIGGVALYVYLPSAPEPIPSQASLQLPQAAPTPPTARPPMRQAFVARPLPQRMPVPTEPPPFDALPNIIHPDPPPQGQSGSSVAGTGFFVASDGSLLTAAHVVEGCRQMRVASKFVRPAIADLRAVDTQHDIALLRARGVRPPSVLSIGRADASTKQVFVLGYPASANPLVPDETWATLENDRVQPSPPEYTDPRNVVWAEAPSVTHGYSGGPIFDPSNGEVVGIVRGMIDTTRLHAVRAVIPASGMFIGPGWTKLKDLLRQDSGDEDDDAPAAVSGDDALDAARRATVHVLCLR